MSDREPNEEQKLAIEHNGGVILRAGAGSGKTFVLVEHIIYLLEQFRLNKLSNISTDMWESEIRRFLGKVVFTTFTKKAAGELSIRAFQRIERQQEKHPEDPFWVMARKCADSLSITTLHGLCFGLLRQGLFPELGNEVKVVSDYEIKQQIVESFDHWYNTFSSEDENENAAYQAFAKWSQDIVEGVLKVFLSPELRIEWTKNENSESNESIIKGLFQIWELDELLDPPEIVWEESKKKWQEALGGLIQITKKHQSYSGECIKELMAYSENVARLSKPSGKEGEGYLEYYELFKSFREKIKKYGQDLLAFLDYQKAFQSWVKVLNQLFNLVEDRYHNLDGFSFSDLEFYVLKSLDEGSRERVLVYLVVDEFQDTSFAQFQIIEKLLDSEFGRFFCVGDKKQAIYGFRGGEIAVFNKVEKLLDVNMSLKSNYRSAESVVAFNNDIFGRLFGTENSVVSYEDQSFKNTEIGKGKVAIIKANLIDEERKKKPVIKEVHQEEANLAFEHIIEKLDEHEGDICCLYRNLAPSKFLIEQLIKKNIPFRAQMKVSFRDDPLVVIFFSLIEDLILQSRGEEYSPKSLKLIQAFSQLHHDKKIDFNALINKFYSQTLSMGIYHAYLVLIKELGFANSNTQNNYEFLSIMIKESRDDLNKLVGGFREIGDNRYSLEFIFGESNPRISIMTSHASKGLQFFEVLVLGIHANDSANRGGDKFGSVPGSLKWSPFLNRKKLFKSPQLMIEEEINKKKDVAESKRLFYVACTRAEKYLTFINISANDKEWSHGKNSWIHLLRDPLLTMDESRFEVIEKEIHSNQTKSNKKRNIPLIYQDNLGIDWSPSSSHLGLVSELSVTRFSLLATCSRKYYFQNICKFDEEEIDLFPGEQEKLVSLNEKDDFIDDQIRAYSGGKGRGTEIHQLISEAIIHQSEPTEYTGKFQKQVQWSLLELENYKSSHEFVSESPIKFKLFTQMISGTPDLVLIPKENTNVLEIWDFKTGKQSEIKDQQYWAQLKTYAHAFFQQSDLYQKINLKIVYIDEQLVSVNEVNYSENTQYLANLWKRNENLLEKNLDYCEFCLYKDLCH